MTRRPALPTQAEVARAIRAARQAGAGAVRILPDGTIKIDLEPGENAAQPVEEAVEIIL